MDTPAQHRRPANRRAIAVGGSLLAHLAMLMVLLTPRTAPPIHIDPDPILVQIVTPPKPPAPPAPEPKADPEPPKAAPAKTEAEKVPKTPPKREIARETPAPARTARRSGSGTASGCAMATRTAPAWRPFARR